MRKYQKQMLLDYIHNEFRRSEYNLAVQVVSDEDVLIGAIDTFIVDLFINEKCVHGLELYCEITREVKNDD